MSSGPGSKASSAPWAWRSSCMYWAGRRRSMTDGTAPSPSSCWDEGRPSVEMDVSAAFLVDGGGLVHLGLEGVLGLVGGEELGHVPLGLQVVHQVVHGPEWPCHDVHGSP